jgi:tetratricopeptide (TPR) repeat protein
MSDTRLGLSALIMLLAGCAGPHEVPRAAAAGTDATGTTAAHPRASGSADYDRLVTSAASFVQIGRLERACDMARAAAQMAPERPEAYVVWGRALASANDLDHATEQFERARQLGSRDRELYLELSSIYDVTRAYDKAIGVYRDWLGTNPGDAEMHQELGLTHLLIEHFAEAAESLRSALALRPDDLQIRQDLGHALLRQGDLTAAATELERVLAVDAKRPEALRLLAQTRAAAGRSEDALKLLDRALTLDPHDPRVLRVRARLRHLSGDGRGALADFRALLAQSPDDAAAMLGAAGALLALERTDEAAPLVAAARQELGDHPDVQFREAQIAWRRADRAALGRLRAITDKVGNPVEVWTEIGLAARKLGDNKLAAEAAKHTGGPHRGP